MNQLDLQEIQNIVKPCLEEESSACVKACPFHLNVKGFIEKMKRKQFNAAYTILKNQVLFPDIVCRICHKPCRKACVRDEIDDPVLLAELELCCMEYADNKEAAHYNVPPKNKNIAIIGAGLAGLSCALKMAERNYQVTVYEKKDKIGGRIFELLEKDIFIEEMEHQFKNVNYTLLLNTDVSDLRSLDFDAAFIATGKDGAAFGFGGQSDYNSLATSQESIFIGGAVIGALPVEAIEHGMRAADAIEKYLKTGSMEGYPEKYPQKKSRLKLSREGIEKQMSVKPASGTIYSQEEAAEEAGRCLGCQCRACKESCELLTFYDKYPRKLSNDVVNTINPVKGYTARTATRMSNMCNMCGCCEEACPEKISVERILQEARRALYKDGALPPVFHDFWIRDMLHSNGASSWLAKNAPGSDKSEYLFFPGCQLGASEPAYVEKTYEYLLDRLPDTGIILGCCGAPAEWAGNEELHHQILTDIRLKWTEFGMPKVILACPTCKKMFHKYIPEMESISLYNIILENGIPSNHAIGKEIQCIFDPCSSRYDSMEQSSVRALVKNLGIETEELPHNKEKSQCCGFGGHIYMANPDYSINLTKKRAEQSDAPYITYCANCRDVFSSVGKKSRHILDIIFDLNNEDRKPPSFTQRRRNREILKENLSMRIWKEILSEKGRKSETIKIEISEELADKMNRQLILEEDVRKTVLYCENSGEYLLDVNSGERTGHLKIGIITYWVTYKIENEKYILLNVYYHRMTFEETYRSEKQGGNNN